MKTRSSFVCQQCGGETPQWYGKCPNCGAWNSLVETTRFTGKTPQGGRTEKTLSKPVNLSTVKSLKAQRIDTGLTEFNRVLGGGIVPGAVMLVAGDPGVGKSTLLLAMLGKVGGLYVAGEESAEQVKLRGERLGIKEELITIIPETDIEQINGTISALVAKPTVIVIDSIQTMTSDTLEGVAGSVGQVRYAAQVLIHIAKETQIPIFIVGHVTKEGTIAGPRVLEHMVDVVCYFEGERYYQGRILRTFKNRFGPTDEVGLFEMAEAGLKEISNPSQLFLEGRITKVAGSTVGVTMEGTRPLLAEIQSLIVPSQLPMPRRVVNGADFNRLQVILAILQKRLSLPLGTYDVFVNVSGGLKLTEPATDLPIALSIISAFKNQAIPEKLASFGELGLLGELRRVQGNDQRIKEATRLGFTKIISPSQYPTLTQVARTIFK